MLLGVFPGPEPTKSQLPPFEVLDVTVNGITVFGSVLERLILAGCGRVVPPKGAEKFRLAGAMLSSGFALTLKATGMVTVLDAFVAVIEILPLHVCGVMPDGLTATLKLDGVVPLEGRTLSQLLPQLLVVVVAV
jgi:hypothetical protein